VAVFIYHVVTARRYKLTHVFDHRLDAVLPAFRKVFNGGALVFPDLLRRLRSVLPDAAIHSVYGSTEAEPIAQFSADEADAGTDAIIRHGGGLCTGLPVPAIQLRVIADRWGEMLGPMDMAEFSRMGIPTSAGG
jgi:hypothetical protein